MTSSRRRLVCVLLASLPAGLPLLILGGQLVPARKHRPRPPAATKPLMQVRLLPSTGEPSAPAVRKPTSQPVAAQPMPAASPDGQAAYLPAAMLSEWPRPLGEPPLLLLDAAPEIIEGVLLINEHGEVDQVWLPDDPLPEQPRRQLQSQLRALRFAPGRLYGRPVRSRLRIALRIG